MLASLGEIQIASGAFSFLSKNSLVFLLLILPPAALMAVLDPFNVSLSTSFIKRNPFADPTAVTKGNPS